VSEGPANQAVWPSKSPVLEGSVLETSGLLMVLEVEGSVRPRSLILSMQSVDGCSSDERAPASIASPRAIGRFIAFPIELFVNLSSPHATNLAHATYLRCRIVNTALVAPAAVGGLGLPSSGRPRNKTVALRKMIFFGTVGYQGSNCKKRRIAHRQAVGGTRIEQW
jgi:hypothetical protein